MFFSNSHVDFSQTRLYTSTSMVPKYSIRCRLPFEEELDDFVPVILHQKLEEEISSAPLKAFDFEQDYLQLDESLAPALFIFKNIIRYPNIPHQISQTARLYFSCFVLELGFELQHYIYEVTNLNLGLVEKKLVTTDNFSSLKSCIFYFNPQTKKWIVVNKIKI